MPRFCTNLSTLFQEIEFTHRFAAASRFGFKAVEFQFPYEFQKERLGDELEQNGLKAVMHNLPPGNLNEGEVGIACHPDRKGEFRDGVGHGLEYAEYLGCEYLNCLAGVAPNEQDKAVLWHTLRENLIHASSECEKNGIVLLIEAINTHDVPGFFLHRSSKVLQMIGEVGSKNLRMQYDIYHMQVMEGDLARTLGEQQDSIGHLQLADNPGRHEPGTGEINFPFLFQHLDQIGYSGWIGCEYFPSFDTLSSLEWIQPYLNR